MACKNCSSGMNIRGGTGPAPSGATSNGLQYCTVLEFCKPIPAIPFNIKTTEPPRSLCGNYQRDLKDFPLNAATITTGDTRIFGQSEMALVFVKFRNYPRSGGQCLIDFYDPNGNTIYAFSSNLPAPQPSWEWWESWTWGVIGHFDHTSGYAGDEIISAGEYSIVIRTDWGTAEIDYTVIDTSCVPYWQCEQPLNGYMSDGCGNRMVGNCNPVPTSYPLTFEVIGPGIFLIMKNGNLVANVTAGTPATISYAIGDTGAFNARADVSAHFVKICDVPQTECQTTTSYSWTVTGQLPQKFVATFEKDVCTPNWKCWQGHSGLEVDGCGNQRENSACIIPGAILSLVSDKGAYTSVETPIFTATYDPKWAGKDCNLLLRGAGSITVVQTKTATASGVTTFNFNPANSGNFVFFAQIEPCLELLNCENSNDVKISITGDDLPCEDWDVACLLEKKDIPWTTLGIGAAGVYILGQLIGGRK